MLQITRLKGKPFSPTVCDRFSMAGPSSSVFAFSSAPSARQMKGVTSQARLNYMLASTNSKAEAFPILFSFSFSLCLHIDSQQAKSKLAFLHPAWKVGPPFPSMQCSVTHFYPTLFLPTDFCSVSVKVHCMMTICRKAEMSMDPVTLHLILVCMLTCVLLSVTL